MNVSVVGRNATPTQRQEYMEYDAKARERLNLAETLIRKFNDIEISTAFSYEVANQACELPNSYKIIYFSCSRVLQFYVTALVLYLRTGKNQSHV